MSCANITTNIPLARNGHIPINITRLTNKAEKTAEKALLELFAVTWAAISNISRPGNAKMIAAMGTEIFGDHMEKAMIVCIEQASPEITTEEKVMAMNGHKKIGGMGGKDNAVMKLAGLFWLLVGAERMGQAERVRVLGAEVQRERGLEFEEMVDIMGKELLE